MYLDESFMKFTIGSILFVTVGFYLAYRFGRNKTSFTWSAYIALLLPPTLVVLWYAYYVNIKVLVLYAVSAIVGFMAEYILGFTYHKVLNRKLWKYDTDAYAVAEYTSWLTLPMWGIAGFVFWMVAKIAGL